MFDWAENTLWLTKITEMQFFEKNNTTGRDSLVVHFGQKFARNFITKK